MTRGEGGRKDTRAEGSLSAPFALFARRCLRSHIVKGKDDRPPPPRARNAISSIATTSNSIRFFPAFVPVALSLRASSRDDDYRATRPKNMSRVNNRTKKADYSRDGEKIVPPAGSFGSELEFRRPSIDDPTSYLRTTETRRAMKSTIAGFDGRESFATKRY